MQRVIRAALLLGLVSAATAGSAVEQPPIGDAKAGHEHFLEYGCSRCHGTSGQGGGIYGPKLAPNPIPWPAVLAELRRPRAMMPVYTPKSLTDAQAADIYAYLKSRPAAKPYQQIPLLNRP